MAKKCKLTKNGETIYPCSTMDAIVHPTLKVPSSKLIGEINVSNLFPTGGTNGTNKYTLESAITKIPTDLRIVGIKCSFLSDAWVVEEWVYQGGTFTSTDSWMQGGSGSGRNMILEWNTDVVTTRKQVPSKSRKSGIQISYKLNGTDWINEQYIGTSISDTYWAADNFWKRIPFVDDVLLKVLEVYNVRILTWNTDVQTTRKQIPFAERKENLILSYKNANNQIVLEQYKNNVFTDANWQYDANWITYIGKDEILSIVNDAVASKATKRVGKNLFTNENITSGYINASGAVTGTTSEYRVTDYIKVDSNLIANYNQGGGTNNAVYDINRNFLRTFNTQNYTYQEGDSFVRYSFSSKWTSYMIEKGDVVTDYEPYTEDAPLLELILQNKKLIQDSNRELINIPIDKVYIQVNINGDAIERDFGVDIPTTASASGIATYIRIKKA